jgi:hypothetical protein
MRARDRAFPVPVKRQGKEHEYSIDDLVSYTRKG